MCACPTAVTRCGDSEARERIGASQFPGRRHRTGHVRRVDAPLRGLQRTRRISPLQLLGQLSHQAQVVVQRGHTAIHDGQVRLLQAVESRTPVIGCELRPVGHGPRGDGVRGGLHVQLDRLPSLSAAGHPVLAMTMMNAL